MWHEHDMQVRSFHLAYTVTDHRTDGMRHNLTSGPSAHNVWHENQLAPLCAHGTRSRFATSFAALECRPTHVIYRSACLSLDFARLNLVIAILCALHHWMIEHCIQRLQPMLKDLLVWATWWWGPASTRRRGTKPRWKLCCLEIPMQKSACLLKWESPAQTLSCLTSMRWQSHDDRSSYWWQ